MKNTKSFLGLAALLLAIIALVLTGCPSDDGGGDNPGNSPDTNGGGGDATSPFEGTWFSGSITLPVVYSNGAVSTATYTSCEITFTGTTWQSKATGGPSGQNYSFGKGTFTYTDTTITCTATHGYVGSSSTPNWISVNSVTAETYTISNGVLIGRGAMFQKSTGGDSVLPSTDGLLTVTGLSAYNGKYIIVEGGWEDGDGHLYLWGIAGINGTATEQIPIGTLISGGQAAIKIYEAETNPLDLNNIKGYSGSDTVQILAYITTTKTLSTSASYEEPVAAGYAQVSFQNGKATATFEFHAPQPVDDDDGGAVTEAAASVPR